MCNRPGMSTRGGKPITLWYLHGVGKWEAKSPPAMWNGPDTMFFDNTGDITLGYRVSIGRGTTILTHEHRHDRNVKLCDAEIDVTPLEIGDDVFIGMHTIICPQVRRIGHGAVIGAGSVVTRDVPDFEIWAGNPAKLIRKRT